MTVAVLAVVSLVIALVAWWFYPSRLVVGKPVVRWVDSPDGKRVASAEFPFRVTGFPRSGKLYYSTSYNPEYFPSKSTLKMYSKPKKVSSPVVVYDSRPETTIYLFVSWISDDGKRESEMVVAPFETGPSAE